MQRSEQQCLEQSMKFMRYPFKQFATADDCVDINNLDNIDNVYFQLPDENGYYEELEIEVEEAKQNEDNITIPRRVININTKNQCFYIQKYPRTNAVIIYKLSENWKSRKDLIKVIAIKNMKMMKTLPYYLNYFHDMLREFI